MAVRVLEGTWEEIAEHAAELSGRRVRVTVLSDLSDDRISLDPKNEAAIALLRSWSEEDAQATPEQRERAEREWAELEANLETNPIVFRVPKVD
jgi:hypothetical protein